ncbi:MAG: N-acetylglucosamine-6-phosphate deacetylase [Clostridia bacterium]|nr:N-acetylglucosamine-6-phosphate deacetylase [Clostridia bacterium]
MITKISGGKVISDGKIISANVYLKDNKILNVTSENLPFDEEYDASGKYVSAGFIDIHTHGAADYDFLDNEEDGFLKIAEAHARHGAGSIVPTITSSDAESTIAAIKTFDKVKNNNKNGANMLGIHLEGPYFAPSQKGAQEERFLRDYDKTEYSEILSASNSILRWTGAPELNGSEEFAQTLSKAGILPCIGHSDADSHCVKKAFSAGFTHITHLYSCTSTVHRKNAFRYAGIVEMAYLIDDMTVEIIADGVHLPADLLKFVYKFKGPHRTALITDSMRGAGMPDGLSVLGKRDNGLDVLIEDGVAKLPDRSAFAGSVAFCDRLVRNMITMAEVPVEDAVIMATKTPADILRIKNKGDVLPGYDADVIAFDENINIYANFTGGNLIYFK